MKKLFLYLALTLSLAGCSVYIEDPNPPIPPPLPPIEPEIITYIRRDGPQGGIVAVVVGSELRAGNYNGPTLAVVDQYGRYIYETAPPQACIGYINGAYILDGPYGAPMAFIDGPYIATSPTGPTMAFMDGNPDNVAGGLGAVYMRFFY